MDLLLLPQSPQWDTLIRLLLPSAPHDKSRYLSALLRVLSRHYLDPVISRELRWWEHDSQSISKVAGAIDRIARCDTAFWTILVGWLLGSGSIGEGIGIRRAALAVLGRSGEGGRGGVQQVREVLERSVKNFGDVLWIKHTPVQVQEGMYSPFTHYGI